MKKEDLRIVFMGTPEFAVESLKALVEAGYQVAGVITMPDKPIGRGHRIQYSAVKEYALSQNLPILQPENLKSEDFIARLKALKADLQVVVAFRMLPEVVWDMPSLGTFNLHASLLPQYRGAAPINWAIINGEKETGATTFFLTHEVDTGNIILQKKIPINRIDNAGIIHDKLMVLGAEMVLETVDLALNGKINAVPQEELIGKNEILKPAPKIFRETCQLSLDKSVEEAYNFVRGLSPYPAAWIEAEFPQWKNPAVLKIFECEPEQCGHTERLGKIVIEGKKSAKLALKDGYLHLKVIQTPGKKRMRIEDFLNGLQ